VIALPTHIGRVVVDRLLRMCGVRPADDQPLPHGDAQVITTRVRS
jgi:hypothetical protein